MHTKIRSFAGITGVCAVVLFGDTSNAVARIRPVTMNGVIVDTSGAVVSGARVYRLASQGRTEVATTNSSGSFVFETKGLGMCTIFATAPGLAGMKITLPCRQGAFLKLILYPSAVSTTVVVEGHVESWLSTVASSISVLTAEDVRMLQTPRLLDALRFLPGVQVNQTGHQGGVSGVFVRGADSRYNLVLVDGVKVNDFGGPYNFSGLTSEQVERLELTAGPQSAAYGSYATGSAIQVYTPSGLDRRDAFVSAEEGTFRTARVTAGGGGKIGQFGLHASGSHMQSDGVVANDDSRLDNLRAKADYIFGGNHRLQYGFMRNDNESGNPGPFGSDPAKLFSGLDLVARTNESYTVNTLRYDGMLSSRIRQQVAVSRYSDQLDFQSGYGPSFSQQNRRAVSSETSFVLNSGNVLVFGGEWNGETFKNSFVTDQASQVVPVQRNIYGLFLENHFETAGKLFVNTGVRVERIQLNSIPADAYGSRPDLPTNTLTQVHPKISLAYEPRNATRLHASFGTGLRPPDGFELAFTTNPALKPERTTSYEIGVEQRFFNQRVALGTTWFHNRFRDQIITLSSSQASLSRWQSDNLANSMTQGLEESIRFQLGRNLSARAAYMYLDTKVLNLDGSSGVQSFFKPGQQLLRRPRHSGSFLLVWQNKRLIAETGLVTRGRMLDAEPNYGISGGQFTNPSYATFDAGLQVLVKLGFWLTSKVSNLTDRTYEEPLGFPALGLNFVVGLKWQLNPR